MAGAGGYDLSCLERHAKLTQFIGKPGQRDPGVAKHVLAVTDILLAAQRDDRSVFDEIMFAPRVMSRDLDASAVVRKAR